MDGLPDQRDEFAASVREAPPLIVVDLRGSLTSLGEAALTDAFRAALERGPADILLNFGGVEYLNSGGIGLTLEVLAQAREAGRRLLVTGLTPHYRKIFHMMGLSQYAPVLDSEEMARRTPSEVSELPHRIS